MKKLVVALLAICTAIAAQAAYVDWSYQVKTKDTGWGKADSGYTAYLLTSAPAAELTSLSDISSAAISSASLAYEKYAKSTYYYTTGTVQAETSATSFYVVLANATDYAILASSVSATPYADQTQGGTGQTPSLVFDGQAKPTSFTAYSTPGGGGTPEPTSGLLLLVGGAMLALRRKQK